MSRASRSRTGRLSTAARSSLVASGPDTDWRADCARLLGQPQQPGSGADGVYARVAGNLEHPGGELRSEAEGAKPPVHPDEGLLCDVLCEVVIGQEVAEIPPHLSLKPAHQLLEGGDITAHRRPDGRRIRFVHLEPALAVSPTSPPIVSEPPLLVHRM